MPFRVIPELAKVAKDAAEGSSSINANEVWHVFQQHVARSHAAEDPSGDRPEVPGVSLAAALPGAGNRPAGKTGG